MAKLKHVEKIFPRICLNCGLKVCTGCEQSKEPSEFFRSSKANDGLQSECKSCSKKRQDERKQRKLSKDDSIKVPKKPNYKTRFCPNCGFKTCGYCQKAKPTTDFRRLSSSKDGFDLWCNSCCDSYRAQKPTDHAKDRAYYARTVERHREIQKTYRDKHKLREAARKKVYSLRKKLEKASEREKADLELLLKDALDVIKKNDTK